MANNFKITIAGAFYLSKSGHDSNDGLTPDTPKKSIINVENNIVHIIGAGHYTTTANLVLSNYRADGNVIIDCLNTPMSHGLFSGSGAQNIEFRNIGGAVAGSSTGQQIGGPSIGCIFKNCNMPYYLAISGARKRNWQSCILIGSSITNSNEGSMTAYGTIFKDSTFGSTSIGGSYMLDSYLDKNSILYSSGLINLRFNNIRGIIKIQGRFFNDGVMRSYALQDQLVGTPQDNGYPIDVKWINQTNLTADGSTVQAVYLDATLDTCINREPLYNNESLEDFTLQANSPHIGRAENGSNIGSTRPAISIYNTSNGTSQITASPEIDTTNPNSWTVKDGFTEGYIDYIEKIGSSSLVLREIEPISLLEFNSDITGGTLGNQNVPDSEPLSFEYPRKLTTTSLAANTTTLNVVGHDVIAGEYVRYAGEDRLVNSVTADIITIDAAFRAAVPNAATFQVGEKVRIGALNPNRLTFMLRTSKEDNPVSASDWDNDIDPIYNKAGDFLTQEWGQIPGYYIDTIADEVWGSGDSETPTGLTKNEISCKWVHVRVYIRNNYDS